MRFKYKKIKRIIEAFNKNNFKWRKYVITKTNIS